MSCLFDANEALTELFAALRSSPQALWDAFDSVCLRARQRRAILSQKSLEEGLSEAEAEEFEQLCQMLAPFTGS
jgi:hypothetical protein